MDIYVIMQVLILFGAIFLGVRLGGMGIGYAGWPWGCIVKPWYWVCSLVRFLGM